MMLKKTLVPCFVILVSFWANAVDHYICSAAPGTHDGSSWTDACTDFSGSCASPIRGDTYWVSAGSYASRTFSTADSGTSVITIKAPTDAAHGASSVGWTNSGGGACHQGQALFQGPLNFNSDYWTFDGSYRGADWRSGYGFKVVYNSSMAGSNNGVIGGNPSAAGHLRIQYVEVEGSHDRNVAADRAIWIKAAANWADSYIGHNWLHDTGESVLIVDSSLRLVIEYNWIQNNGAYQGDHAEGIAERTWGCTSSPPCANPTTDLTIRYNKLENIKSTTFVGDPQGSGNYSSGFLDFYGNVMFYNSAEEDSGQTATGTGQGGFSLFQSNWINGTGTIRVLNNTSYYMHNATKDSSTACASIVEGGQEIGSYNVIVENNIWYNCPGTAALIAQTGANFTWDHQYYNSISNGVTDPDTNKQIDTGGNPFVKCCNNVKGENDFHLVRDTNAWKPLPSPYNQDMDGNIRTSSRGAFQFGGVTATAPAAPTGLTASVQ